MWKSLLLSSLAVAGLLLSSSQFWATPARPGALVDVSTRFVTVPAGSFAGDENITLAATLYQPRFLLSAPAVVYIHGWGGHRLTGEDNLAYYVAAAGYIVLSYTARGFGDGESGGRATLAGQDEIEDLRHVIDWLKNDPDHAIGPRVTKIGVIGGSYGGGHSFQISSDPRVSAVIPLVGWTDLEQALYPNGAINYRLGIAEFYSGLQQDVGQPPFFNYTQLEFDLFDAAAEGRPPTGAALQALRARSIAHQDPDRREVIEPARQPRVPVFMVQSWDDYLFPSSQVLDVYSQLTVPKQLYLGRTGHPPGGNKFEGEELYIAEQILRWFDRYLRGFGASDPRPISSAPAPFTVLPYTANSFPSDDLAPTNLFLKRGGLLARKKKGPAEIETAGGIFRPERIRSSRLGADIPTSDDMLSARVERSSDSPLRLEYTSPPWTEETEVIGPAEFSVFVSSATSTELDVVVRTFDVAPEGTETEITVGAARATQLGAGEIRRITFRDFGDDWVFKRGHSLRVKISNIDFPTFRPPGSNDNLASQITIHTGKKFPSRLTVLVRRR